MKATLFGDVREPKLRLKFPRDARHATSGMPLLEWVRGLPGRHWDPENACWVVFSLGTKYKGMLSAAGFEFASEMPDNNLADLIHPLVTAAPGGGGQVLIWPRLLGFAATQRMLPARAPWQKGKNHWLLTAADLIRNDEPLPGFVFEDGVLEQAEAALAPRTRHEAADSIPDWFGLAMDPYQVEGALLTTGGQSMLCDPPGLGKGSPPWVKILTPTGWTTYGEVRVGEHVIGSDGKPTVVTGVYPRGELDVFRVTMTDGGSVVVDGEHLWPTKNGIYSTAEIGQMTDVSLPVVAPVAFENGAFGGSVQARQEWLSKLPLSGATFATRDSDSAAEVVDVLRSLGNLAKHVVHGDEHLIEVAWNDGTLRRRVQSVEPAGRDQVICISVAAQDQLYVTEDFIVTHNTRQFIGAAAAVDADRTLVVCPPVVLTHWAREIDQSGLSSRAPATKSGDPATTVVIRAGRKQPELPAGGVIVVPDSLVAARPALHAELCEWLSAGKRSAFAYDEAHRAKTWGSKRSTAAIALSSAATRLSVPMSGTPMMSNPVELAPMLAMSGHLGPVFGGWSTYSERYARQDRFGGFRPPPAKMLAELKSKLDDGIWIRRPKPKGHGKFRRPMFVDVDPALFAEAHGKVVAAIDLWLDDYLRDNGKLPDLTSADPADGYEAAVEWCGSQISLVTLLRQAAGLSKVPVISEMIKDWLEGNPSSVDEQGRTVYERPLTIWVHHIPVAKAMVDAVDAIVPGVGAIMGGTSKERTAQLVDDFQVGLVPVLICSIKAAGVGITLTRGSDMWLAEADWTPSLIEQAEGRHDRRGQTRPVYVTTLIATGTLDERIQKVLLRKAETLEQVLTGGDHHVGVTDGNGADSGDILMDLMAARIDARHAKQKPRRRAA